MMMMMMMMMIQAVLRCTAFFCVFTMNQNTMTLNSLGPVMWKDVGWYRYLLCATWNPEMLVSKRTLLFQGPVFRFSIKVDERKHNLGHVYRDIHNCVCVLFLYYGYCLSCLCLCFISIVDICDISYPSSILITLFISQIKR